MKDHEKGKTKPDWCACARLALLYQIISNVLESNCDWSHLPSTHPPLPNKHPRRDFLWTLTSASLWWLHPAGWRQETKKPPPSATADGCPRVWACWEHSCRRWWSLWRSWLPTVLRCQHCGTSRAETLKGMQVKNKHHRQLHKGTSQSGPAVLWPVRSTSRSGV